MILSKADFLHRFGIAVTKFHNRKEGRNELCWPYARKEAVDAGLDPIDADGSALLHAIVGIPSCEAPLNLIQLEILEAGYEEVLRVLERKAELAAARK